MGRDDDHKSGSITSSYRFNYHPQEVLHVKPPDADERRRGAYMKHLQQERYPRPPVLHGESYPKRYSGTVSGYPPVGNAARLPESLLPTSGGAMYPPLPPGAPMFYPPQLPPPGAGVPPYVAEKTDNSGGKTKIVYTYSFEPRQPPSSQNVIDKRTPPYEFTSVYTSPSVGAPYRYESAPPPGARTQSLGSVEQEDEPPPAQRDWGRTRTMDSYVTHPPNKSYDEAAYSLATAPKQVERVFHSMEPAAMVEDEGPYDEDRRRRAYQQHLNNVTDYSGRPMAPGVKMQPHARSTVESLSKNDSIIGLVPRNKLYESESDEDSDS